MGIEAVLFDVGGVLLVPDGKVVGAALVEAAIDFDSSRFPVAHFAGIEAIETGEGPGENKTQYLNGYVAALAVRSDQQASAVDVLLPLWDRPSIELWRCVLHDAVAELRRLADAGVPVGIVSNADGTVEDQLREHQICQLGEGAGVPVLAIIDSFRVGVAKPNAEVFRSAVDSLGVAPEAVAYVGDTVRYDVAGARAAGLVPLHYDPTAYCTADDHEHLRAISELWSMLDCEPA